MGRDVARDLVRGTAVVEMEVVNHIDAYEHSPPGVNALTYADTVFPTYAVLSGMGPVRSGRSALLVGLGLVYNWSRNPHKRSIRLYGVLQRLGLSGLLLGGIGHGTTSVWFPLACASTWLVATFKLAQDSSRPFRPPEVSGQSWIDTQVASISPSIELYRNGYDPEGLLGTLMTATSMWFGHWLVKYPMAINDAIVSGLSLMSFGYMISYAFPRCCPMSKPYWTPSFTLTTSGLVLLKYTAAVLLIPYLPYAVRLPIESLGKRALEVYLLSGALDMTPIRSKISEKFTNNLVGQWAATTVCTSLLAVAAWGLVQLNIKI